MKKYAIPLLIISALLFSQIGVYASDTLPVVRLPPTNLFITMCATDGTNSWFDLSLKDIPKGYDITNGIYLGWCMQKSMKMTRGVNHTVRLYSSYDPQMPLSYQSENWSKINYVLNHKHGDRDSIQRVIWYYTSLEDYPSDPDAQVMIADADQNGITFVPHNGEVLAVLVEGVQAIQRTFFEFIIPTSSQIGHLVWYDFEADGIQDQGESGIAKVTVYLYSKDNILKKSAITDEKGYYSFANIESGEYYLQFVLPNGYQFSPQDADENDAIDSDADTTTGKTILFTVGTNESNSNWDAGMYYSNSNSGSSTNGGGTGGSIPNHAPTADASLGEPYKELTQREITFDGTMSYDRDGKIVSWHWNFGDGKNGSGDVVKHSYLMPGEYIVTLTVTDDDGATDSYTTIAVVALGNRSPTKPVVSGPITGHKNMSYEYTAVSTDLDEDYLKYIFDWGDGETSTTKAFPCGTPVIKNHKWSTAGRYTINVKSSDNMTKSVTTTLIILIDALDLGDIGYLIDENSDGIYEIFHSNAIGKKTKVETLSNSKYLINSDGYGTWDYEYNTITNELNFYYKETVEEPVEFYLAIYVLLIVSIFIIFIFFILGKTRKRSNKKNVINSGQQTQEMAWNEIDSSTWEEI